MFGSTDVCETIDGDCPDDCSAAGFAGNENFNAKLKISPAHPDIELKANSADKYITSQGNVTRLDDPLTGLHTTVYYFCCYTPQEKATIKRALREDMVWSSFVIDYDSFACNLDHDNVTVYLHALPSDQNGLFDLAHTIEATVRAAGVAIPTRETLFHMTLARVGYEYPTDDVVEYFLDNSDDWNFGSLTMDHFFIEDEVIRASDA